VDPLAPLTARQIAAMINQAVAAGTAPVRTARRRARRQATDLEERTKGLAEGFAQLLRDIGPGIEGAYANAANSQAAFAKGFSDDQAATQQRDAQAAAEMLNRIGAPQAQIQQVQGQGRGVGDVSYGLGGYIPSSALNREGAAFGAAARQLPGYALGRGQQNVAAIQRKLEEQETELDEKLSDLVPSLRFKALQDILANERANEATRIQREYLGLAGSKQSFDQDLALAGLAAAQQEKQAEKQGTQAAAKGAARTNRQNALSTNRDKAFDEAQALYEGKPITDPKRKYEAISQGRDPVERPTYQEAYSKLFTQYGQPLMRLAPSNGRAWWKRQIDAFIANALKTAGFVAPPPKQRRRGTTTGRNPGPTR
jgi:hypothetical protein